jgi:hypothetical protein
LDLTIAKIQVEKDREGAGQNKARYRLNYIVDVNKTKKCR